MTHSLPTIPAADWNRLAAELARKFGLTFGGRSRGRGYRLPWEIAAVWNPFYAQWEAGVHPGYVNALETLAPRVTWDRAPKATRERLAASSGAPVRPWLSEGPFFPLASSQMRRIGYDADPSQDPETVPEYFAALGVGTPPRIDLDAEDLSIRIVQDGELDGTRRRLLRAVDIVLTIPKPSAGVVASPDPTGQGAVLDVTLSSPPAGALPSVSTVRAWRPPAESGDLLEALTTGRTDPPTVERRVGTVFFISPPGAPIGSDPNPLWTPVIRQDMTYNRVLATRSSLESLPRLNLRLATGLAGGVADPFFARLLDPLNEADAAASLALSTASVQVAEWTL